MLNLHLDAVASLLNFIAGIVLATDALRARKRTKIKRGGEKLVEGLKERGDGGLIVDPSGNALNDIPSLENWADRRTVTGARVGFWLLAAGFGLDLFSKLFSNPLLFSK